jgi:anti-sigma B factor antagonist
MARPIDSAYSWNMMGGITQSFSYYSHESSWPAAADSGSLVMPAHRRLEVSEVGTVTVVRFVDRKILDAANIQELGDELFGLVEQDKRKNLLLNFSNVEFMSSAALNKLIVLNKKVQGIGGKMRLSNLRPEIYDVFVITRLNTVFDIKTDEADALAAFAK